MLLLTVFAQRIVADFLLKNSLSHEKWSICVFELPYRGLGAMYTVHLRLTGKPVADFLLAIIALFSLSVMAGVLGANID